MHFNIKLEDNMSLESSYSVTFSQIVSFRM